MFPHLLKNSDPIVIWKNKETGYEEYLCKIMDNLIADSID